LQGLSEQAISIMGQSRRSGTKSAYDTAWSKWVGWCGTQQVDPFQASMASVINFMSTLCQKGLEYSTLNVYRSALSAYHPEIDGQKAGQHPLMKQFMAGAFNAKPPQPRYTDTWDVDQVLQYLRRIGANAQLTDKQLTLKLAMLMSLTNVTRAQELQCLNPQLMEDHGNSIKFHVAKLTKTKRPSKPHLSFTVREYPDEGNLDVVRCLRIYLARTESWRIDALRREQLFLALVKPHGPVAPSTISRWLRELMQWSGVDTTKFKGHSVRGAATSKVWNAGMSVAQILEKANWSRANTFWRFYGREVPDKDQFQRALLN